MLSLKISCFQSLTNFKCNTVLSNIFRSLMVPQEEHAFYIREHFAVGVEFFLGVGKLGLAKFIKFRTVHVHFMRAKLSHDLGRLWEDGGKC